MVRMAGRCSNSITLPLIKPVMSFILVTSLVGGMQMFDIPMLLTDGRGSPEIIDHDQQINVYEVPQQSGPYWGSFFSWV